MLKIILSYKVYIGEDFFIADKERNKEQNKRGWKILTDSNLNGKIWMLKKGG